VNSKTSNDLFSSRNRRIRAIAFLFARNKHNHMLIPLLALVVSTAPQSKDLSRAKFTDHPWEVFGGLSATYRPMSAGVGGIGSLGVTRSIFPWLRAEINAGLGLASNPVDELTYIRIGTRLEWPTEMIVRPYVWVAFAHQHETPWESAKAHVVDTALGLSEHGTTHRSGLESGLGLSVDLFARKGLPIHGRVSARVTGVFLLGSGAPITIDASTFVGLCF
jgi:hypothetical protein